MPHAAFRRHGNNAARAAIATTEKICLIIRARRWAATAMSGTRGVCVVSAGQAPYRARSMRARGGDIFNGVTQNTSCHITLGISQASDTSLLAFQSSANSCVTVTVPPHHRVGSRGRARGWLWSPQLEFGNSHAPRSKLPRLWRGGLVATQPPLGHAGEAQATPELQLRTCNSPNFRAEPVESARGWCL